MWLLLLLLCAAASGPLAAQAQPNGRQQRLIAALDSLSPRDLIARLWFHPAIDRLHARSGFQAADFQAVATQADAPMTVRFGALFILYCKDSTAYVQVPAACRAELMCASLAQDYAGMDQAWGTLWMNGSVGELGAMVVGIGDDAVPALAGLLDDPSPRSRYHGSVDATQKAMMGLRVKDHAAYYIARIRHYDLPWHADVDRRDKAIERMRRRLRL